jgi:hypothetical protein
MKIKIIIGGEIPYKHTNHSQYFRNIKIDPHPVAEQVHKRIVQTQTNYGDKNKFYQVNISALAPAYMKRPFQV